MPPVVNIKRIIKEYEDTQKTSTQKWVELSSRIASLISLVPTTKESLEYKIAQLRKEKLFLESSLNKYAVREILSSMQPKKELVSLLATTLDLVSHEISKSASHLRDMVVLSVPKKVKAYVEDLSQQMEGTVDWKTSRVDKQVVYTAKITAKKASIIVENVSNSPEIQCKATIKGITASFKGTTPRDDFNTLKVYL